ncbi:hypothetical protein IAE22_34495, partial [Bacillus sp. S34]|nr:hypothetical protein [Bacillus sp. S34]
LAPRKHRSLAVLRTPALWETVGLNVVGALVAEYAIENGIELVVVGPEASQFLDRDGVWPPPRTTTSTFGGGGLVVRFDDGWEALEAFLD